MAIAMLSSIDQRSVERTVLKTFRANLPAYRQFVSAWLQTAYMYRANLMLNVGTILFRVYLLKVVWTAVYAGRATVQGVDLHIFIAYLTVTNLQLWLLQPALPDYLRQRIRDGQIALDLVRPVGFLEQLLAQQVGVTAALAPFVALAFPFAFVLGGLAPPASPAAALLYPLSLLLAYVISTLIGLLLGLSAFWTFEILGFLLMYQFITAFFAGALVPIWLFPAPLQTVSALLPFQSQAFVPVAIYLGRLTGGEIVRALAIQLFWSVALALLARTVWRRALRRVVVQGG